MKKIIITLLVLTMVLGCVACKSDTGGKENTSPPASDSTPDNGDPDNGKENESDKDKKPTKDITMEDLLNHPESPESDFACTGDETTGLTIVRYDGDDEIVVIPEKIRGIPVVEIATFTFANRDDIKAVRLSDSVTEIMKVAFTNNEGIELFASGSGLEIIGKAAFQGCKSLREVRLNEGLKTIKASAFGFCTSLSSVDIPASVGEMPRTPFSGMSDDFTVIVEKGSVNAKDAERIAELGYIKVEYR